MLILTKKIGEAIILDDDIEITVMEIQNGQVRFGIDAPKEVKVYREEIYERMQAEADRDKDAAWIAF